MEKGLTLELLQGLAKERCYFEAASSSLCGACRHVLPMTCHATLNLKAVIQSFSNHLGRNQTLHAALSVTLLHLIFVNQERARQTEGGKGMEIT